jgi:preprotein translocase subunit SecG
MQTTVLIIHTLIALGIIILVLMQRGKGAEAGAAFGAGASGTVFGSRGSSSFFSRATGILATAFFVTSLSLAWISSQAVNTTDSLLEDIPATEVPQAAPADELIPDLPETDAPAPAVDDVPALDPETPAEEAPPQE